MKVVIVSCVYSPEPAVSARTSADLAHVLSDRGHDVTVICPFPSRPSGRVAEGFRRSWKHVTHDGGVRVERRWSTLSRTSTLASRFAENLTFGVRSALALLRMPRPAVAYLNSWPLVATGLAVLALSLRRVPYLLSVQDVYPESLLVQRRPVARLLGRLLRRIDAAVARRAEALIVLSPGFASLYQHDRAVAPARIHVVPNWVAENAALPDAEAGRAYRRERAIPEEAFVVGYGGNVGVAAAVEQLIEAFRFLDARFHLIVAGSGPRVAACVALAREIAPARIHFQDPWPAEMTSAVLSAADLLAMPTLGEQSAVSVPSKLLTYLLMDKPVLAIARPDSEVARVIEDAGAGWVVPSGDAGGLADAIRQASAASPRGGREYALRAFGRDVCLARLVALLERR